ncbi:NF-kappa-B inhibitor-like protein 1 isoform X2 [Lingula anatina]|nr:NF-kappa-B inhibitor-like protein 1 isoform X2 [Lingula anatina]XP_013403949.1 NF-kappa-B inhibitor-like protein 1 isoform X2 [Lingula anatina]XP_013403950.1 NF-kappa-B inhibitor-like protein 1 isoform X2 [Lingula anatina]XP_013403951.1 NF-kappa-B inhibitor-like protein 1 isoform X2 [Lingula anatina]|eukprot:XP_013403948.1 NF-kappa-B inhibitor-like protein 1 isoform X2 [Lingula anatina]
MTTKRNITRLVRYIEEDRVHRLKSYVKKHSNIDVSTIRLDHDRTLLHLACLGGHDACIRFLLKKGVDPLLCDADGNLGIHLAAIYATKTGNSYVYTDLVLPLIKACSHSLDVANNRGVTARELLVDVKTRLRHHVTQTVPEAPEETPEENWTDKLFSELQDDLEERYEYDFYHDSHQPRESYEEWSSRMAKEKFSKEQHYHGADRKRKTKDEEEKEKEKQKKFQRKLEQEHEEYLKLGQRKEEEVIQEKRQKYEEQCLEFFSGNSSSQIRYRDIPWPDKTDVWRGAEIVTGGENRGDPTIFKKYLREQRVRWHPDKFLQKCGHRLKQDEREKILEKIKEISQTLNKLCEDIEAKTS